MPDNIAIEKDDSNERKVPTSWRQTLSEIVECFKNDNFELHGKVKNVKDIEASEAERIKKNINSYGGKLSSISQDTWNYSVYIWMEEYWQIIVDLSIDGELSDLIMSLRAFENNGYIEFEVMSVHVP